MSPSDADGSSPAVGASPFPPPNIPDHKLIRVIGSGSFGEVWLARNIMGSYRAVKVVRRARFETSKPYEREFEGVRKFEPISRTHESLVDVLQVGINELEGYFYCVMELADDAHYASDGTAGEPLAPDPATYVPKTLKLLLEKGTRILVADCVDYGFAIARALEHLHAEGLVHRDVKPSNVIFVNGAPKLGDIGLITETDASFTGVGTSGFFLAEAPGTVRSDLYGLGKVLYEAMTGKDRNQFPEPPVGLDEAPDREAWQELNEVVMRACGQDRDRRYGTAKEIGEDLVLLRAGRSVLQLRKLERRLAILTRLGWAAIVALTIGAATYFWQERQTRLFKQISDESNQRLVRSHVANGVRLMDEGDYANSLLWFVGALQVEQGKPEREEIHRYRIESVLQRCPKLVAFGYHDSPVEYGAFSPDGSRVVTASTDGTAQLWNTSDSRRIGNPMRHEAGLEMAVFSPDGTCVATASHDGTARIWDAWTGEAVSSLVLHRKLIYFVAFDPTGQRIATASKDGAARIWDASSGKALTEELRHEDEVNMATFSPDGKALLTASDDRTARLWDTVTGRELLKPMRHEDHVRCALFSPDGRAVATGARDGIIRFWSASTGEQIAPEKRLWVAVRDLRFSPDGERVYGVGGDHGQAGELRGWQWRNGRELFKPISIPERLSHVGISADGRWLLTTGGDGKARVYDAIQGTPAVHAITQPRQISKLAFDPQSGRILTTSLDGTWRIWDWASGLKNEDVLEQKGQINFLRFLGGGKRVLIGSSDGVVREYDMESRRDVRQLLAVGREMEWLDVTGDGRLLAASDHTGFIKIFDLKTSRIVSQHENHWQHVVGLFDHSGKRFIEREVIPLKGKYVSRSSYAVRIWDVATGNDLLPPLLHSNLVYEAVISPDDRLVASSCGDKQSRAGGYVRIWDRRTGQAVTEPMTYRSTPVHMEFSHNVQFLLVSTTDEVNGPGMVEIRAVDDWRILGKPVHSSGGISAAVFSLDARQFFAADIAGSARIYDTLTGEAESQAMRHGRGVSQAGFSTDGRRVFTSSGAGFVRWWDAHTGEPITPLWPHAGRELVATCSPDGRTLISITSDNGARLWRLTANTLPKPELDKLARLLTGRKLDAIKGPEAIPPSELLELWQSVGKLQAASGH